MDHAGISSGRSRCAADFLMARQDDEELYGRRPANIYRSNRFASVRYSIYADRWIFRNTLDRSAGEFRTDCSAALCLVE